MAVLWFLCFLAFTLKWPFALLLLHYWTRFLNNYSASYLFQIQFFLHTAIKLIILKHSFVQATPLVESSLTPHCLEKNIHNSYPGIQKPAKCSSSSPPSLNSTHTHLQDLTEVQALALESILLQNLHTCGQVISLSKPQCLV